MPSFRRADCLVVALVVTFASHAFPEWVDSLTYRWAYDLLAKSVDPASVHPALCNYFYGLQLLFGVLLVAGSPRRHGLRIGEIGRYKYRVLLVCGGPLIVAWVGCQFVDIPVWMRSCVGVWLISPLAQDLVFVGFLYTILRESFPGHLHRRVPIDKGLLLGAMFFSLWHAWNFRDTDAGFVCLQMCYTFAGGLLVGLTRQWTGSLFYVTAVHMGGNFLGWYYAPEFPMFHR